MFTFFSDSHRRHFNLKMDEFYIHLSSTDSEDTYPHNTPADFRVQLPERVRFHGIWQCALAEIQYLSESSMPKTISTNLWVSSNVCCASIVGNTKAPILRCLTSVLGTYTTYDYSLQHLHYYPVKLTEVDVIHIYINTDDGNKASFLSGTLKVTLHFRQSTA